MTQSLKIDRDKTAVVIMDFQQRIIANNASEPENVVKQAASVLEGARKAGGPPAQRLRGSAARERDGLAAPKMDHRPQEG